MGIVVRLLGIGALIIGAIIFLTFVLILMVTQQLDLAVTTSILIPKFLIIDLGGLLIEIVRKLLTKV